MKLSKWGNSFAIRLPAGMIQEANLKEGDDLKVRVVGDLELEISRDAARREALEVIRRLRRPLPPGYKFDREEANERGFRREPDGMES
jgi:antitoxin MazE